LKWSLPFMFSDQNYVCLIASMFTVCLSSYPPWSDHPNNIIKAFKLRSCLLFSLLQPPAPSSCLWNLSNGLKWLIVKI
jgi:hypothetical protein